MQSGKNNIGEDCDQPNIRSVIPENLPPMLKLYLDYKKTYPDCLIFFQVGDFYEVFFEDARIAAQALNLTLTSRDKSSDQPIPMCGVPIAVIESYLGRLVNAGYSVAIISQLGSGNVKGGVPRKLERIVTPGVRILENGNAQGDESRVASLWESADGNFTLAFSDLLSARIQIRDEISAENLGSEIGRVSPAEIILPHEVNGRTLDKRSNIYRLVLAYFGREASIKFRHAGSSGRDLAAINGYLTLSPAGKKAATLLVSYVDETTVDQKVPIQEISLKSYRNVVAIDATTRHNLELIRNCRDATETNSLLSALNQTKTNSGYKKLKSWILAPLTDVYQIQSRQEAVAFFIEQPLLREQVRTALGYVVDLERLATRSELGAITPREAASLREAFRYLPKVIDLLSTSSQLLRCELLANILGKLHVPSGLAQLLESALADSPSLSLAEGGVIRNGFSAELDRLRNVKSDGSSWMIEFESKERERTGINSLKVRYNQVFGYYIEISQSNLAKVPDNYVRKQTLVNAERFVTEELKVIESEVLGAFEKQVKIETQIFEDIRKQILSEASTIRLLGSLVAEIDVLSNLAEVAERQGYVRPLVDQSEEISIQAGKHPVVARLLGNNFIPNALNFEKANFMMITGPNMGGKSTYLRQAALLVIMAQIGSFIPAASAKLGIVDKIFARLGASDDLAEGHSTFMVEMKEAMNILTSATEKSLILIDEIGRGTATQDGLAIAQAIVEWLILKTKARTLFATHFHELTELSKQYKQIVNLSVGSVEQEGQVLFTHQICSGPANKSYGIEVAKLAGVPEALIRRARELMAAAEARENVAPRTRQLTLFDGNPKVVTEIFPTNPELTPDLILARDLKKKLDEIDVNNLTPLEALNLLSNLKAKKVTKIAANE